MRIPCVAFVAAAGLVFSAEASSTSGPSIPSDEERCKEARRRLITFNNKFHTTAMLWGLPNAPDELDQIEADGKFGSEFTPGFFEVLDRVKGILESRRSSEEYTNDSSNSSEMARVEQLDEAYTSLLEFQQWLQKNYVSAGK